MRKNIDIFVVSTVLFISSLFSADVFSAEDRYKRITEALDRIEHEVNQALIQTSRLQEVSQPIIPEPAYVEQISLPENKSPKNTMVSKKENTLPFYALTEEQRRKIRKGLMLKDNIYTVWGFQTGYIKGDSTYHINFDGGASELEFPLDTVLVGFKGGILYMRNGEDPEIYPEWVSLNISWMTSASHTGKMKDSDWIDGDGHPGKDIYSESSTDLNAVLFDINFVYNFWRHKNFVLGLVGGYRHYTYNYEVFDTNQVGYGPYHPAYTGYVPGDTLSYSVKYKLPYMGIKARLSFNNKLILSFLGGYSPEAKATDRDDHLLRAKLSIAKCTGEGYFLHFDSKFHMAPYVFINLGGDYTKIATTGIQHQSFYAGPFMGTTYDVSDWIKTSSWLAYLSFDYLI